MAMVMCYTIVTSIVWLSYLLHNNDEYRVTMVISYTIVTSIV